jgi:rhodanese-related sulfurtransferase
MFFFKRTATDEETTVDALHARLANDDHVFMLDVRQPDEYREAHVGGSTLIPLDQLVQRLDELPRDRQIVAICRTGNRSGVATGMLRRAGFDAINLKGGIVQWQKRGLPVERGR